MISVEKWLEEAGGGDPHCTADFQETIIAWKSGILSGFSSKLVISCNPETHFNNVPAWGTMTSSEAHGLARSSLDVYTGSRNVTSKPKVLNLWHLLTASQTGVNWCRWPVKPAASGADGAEALRLIIAAINSINRLEPLGEREEQILHAKSNPSPELWDNPDMYYSVLSFPCLKKPVSFLCLTCCLQTSCFLSHAAVDLQLYRFDKEF